MSRKDRLLLYLVALLLFSAGLLMCGLAKGQAMPGALTMPAHLSRSPEYWYSQYTSEHLRAELLERSGHTAISGLQADLTKANSRITEQNKTITAVVSDRDLNNDRAVNAETKLAQCEGKQPKTWAGKQLKKVASGIKTGFAVVGIIAIPILFIR